jgi:curli production assembly/transport component CsgG
VGDRRQLHLELRNLPPPEQQVFVAVYDFPDLTGQFKPSETVQTLSRAVTQGAAAILIDILREAGRGAWFTVVERQNLENLLRERQIIGEMRSRYRGREPPPPIRPLLYAGIIIEGGIIGFDTNNLTGGVGARFLGIGGDVEYREDIVSIYLRAINSQTGEVLSSVRTTKRILSYGAAMNVFKFISFQDLLEVEAGFTTNEPGTLALREAIELAVYALVVEGAEDGLWNFGDQEAGREITTAYYEQQDLGDLTDAEFAAMQNRQDRSQTSSLSEERRRRRLEQ